jgi:hypothetical protein
MSYQVKTELAWNGADVKIKGREVIGKTIYETGLIVQGQAVVLAPRKTGYLAGSIVTTSSSENTDTRPADDGRKAKGIDAPRIDNEVFVGTSVEYAMTQEFLHQPFLRPALDLAQGKVLDIGVKNSRQVFKDYLK